MFHVEKYRWHHALPQGGTDPWVSGRARVRGGCAAQECRLLLTPRVNRLKSPGVTSLR